jgi:hypothetical protein
MPERLGRIESDLLLVGEGTGDASLIKYLAQERGITGFQVEDSGGSSKFRRFIEGLSSIPGYSGMKGLVIIADSDQGADESFSRIRSQLKAAKIHATPGTPFRVGRSPQSDFATYVVMLPFTGSGDNITSLTGALETLLLPAAIDNYPDAAKCTDEWRDCVQMGNWKNAHRDKARLRALIAAAYPDDPNISLTWALRPESKIVPLNHPCFDALAELLRSLRGIMGL